VELPTPPGFVELLGVEWLEVTASRVVGRLVIDERHLQPYGIVHGGVYATIAESAASIGAHLSAVSFDPANGAVGLENHTTFLRAAGAGTEVIVEATPLHAGRRAQAWTVDIRDGATKRQLAVSQVRLMVVQPGALQGPR
jgi:1,4-dihydroxy-2-naphthoyl-CoA hydrolase